MKTLKDGFGHSVRLTDERLAHILQPDPAPQAGGGCLFERDGQSLQGAGGLYRRGEGR